METEKKLHLEKKEMIRKHIGNIVNDETLLWLDECGYYTAPASTKYHGAYMGGLYDHSLNVAMNLLHLSKQLGLSWQRPESPSLIGFLHDICKVDQYLRIEENGSFKYVWNTTQKLDGHGVKSCILISRHMKLTEEELMCIRYHMGAFEDEKSRNAFSEAIKKYPNVLYTHMADMIASHIQEEK